MCNRLHHVLPSLALAIVINAGCGNGGQQATPARAPDSEVIPTRIESQHPVFTAAIRQVPGALQPDHERPERETLDMRTQEVLRGSSLPWTVDVPKNAWFRASVALLAEENDSGSAQFRVTAKARDGQTRVLLTQSVPRSAANAWVPIQASLEAYAGQSIDLLLDVETTDPQQILRAVWGAPAVIHEDRRPETTPVVLISLDTLRADHLGCYGYQRDTTPHLDAFARDAARFETAIVYEPSTLTSHMTMLTGLHHERHGVNHTQNLAEERITLAERLREAGYISAAFVGHGWWLDPHRGFQQGFDQYTIPETIHFESVTRTLEKTALWLENLETDRFFLFFHTYEIHSKSDELGYHFPYEPSDHEYLHFARDLSDVPFPSDPLATNFLWAASAKTINVTPDQHQQIVDLYDDSIRMVDDAVGRLFAKLKKKQLYDKAIIIVTADHGEDFFEHGRYLHDSLHETSVRVPLLVKFPNSRFAGHTNTDLVTNADLMPTILDALALPSQNDIDGISLLAGLSGGTSRHEKAQLTFPPTSDALRTPEWKLIHNFRFHTYELYNVKNDPLESQNRYDEAPPVLAALEQELTALQQLRPGWHIAVRGGDGANLAQFEFVAPAGLECSLRRGESMGEETDVMEVAADRTSAKVTTGLSPRDTDEVIVLASGSPVQLNVHIPGDVPFTMMARNETFTATDYNVVLHPDDTAWQAIPPRVGPGMASIRIWHVPPPKTSEDIREISPEDIEAIESLGYLSP